jgi:hypothetical protein
MKKPGADGRAFWFSGALAAINQEALAGEKRRGQGPSYGVQAG